MSLSFEFDKQEVLKFITKNRDKLDDTRKQRLCEYAHDMKTAEKSEIMKIFEEVREDVKDLSSNTLLHLLVAYYICKREGRDGKGACDRNRPRKKRGNSGY